MAAFGSSDPKPSLLAEAFKVTSCVNGVRLGSCVNLFVAKLTVLRLSMSLMAAGTFPSRLLFERLMAVTRFELIVTPVQVERFPVSHPDLLAHEPPLVFS
jgi:hypothetical protein